MEEVGEVGEGFSSSTQLHRPGTMATPAQSPRPDMMMTASSGVETRLPEVVVVASCASSRSRARRRRREQHKKKKKTTTKKNRCHRRRSLLWSRRKKENPGPRRR